jgi:hypothetical protein
MGVDHVRHRAPIRRDHGGSSDLEEEMKSSPQKSAGVLLNPVSVLKGLV